jgi:hypothetical protein
VEDVVCVLVNDTTLARWAQRKAIETTERRITDTASLTGGGLSSQVQHFVFDKLISKLFPILKPLLKVGLNTCED